jgi:tRNA (adenine57-N1/adenine58-N1)-methyltransferase catalytic subunit
MTGTDMTCHVLARSLADDRGNVLRIAQAHDLVILLARDGKRYLTHLRPGDRFHTNRGYIEHDSLIGQPLGREVLSQLGQSFMVLRPSLHDLLMNLKRVSQIIYPKEIGQILLKLDVGNSKRIIEAGTGSGALTIALAHGVQPGGRVYSYELREDMLKVARRNLEMAGLLDYVQFVQRDIAEGFTETDVDALFLDVREPWSYLAHVCAALSDGGFFGALVPTTNQVSWLLAEMGRYPFASIEVMEILLRAYKPVAARLRPQDVMVGHTGFLIFGRKVALLPETEAGAYALEPNEKEE